MKKARQPKKKLDDQHEVGRETANEEAESCNEVHSTNLAMKNARHEPPTPTSEPVAEVPNDPSEVEITRDERGQWSVRLSGSERLILSLGGLEKVGLMVLAVLAVAGLIVAVVFAHLS